MKSFVLRLLTSGPRSRRPSRPPAVEWLEDRTVPSTFTVNTTVDSVDTNPGDGVAADSLGRTSLRAAVMEANALPGADTINLPAGTYALSLAGSEENGARTGDLDITDGLTIVGAGAALTAVDATNLNDRVFDVRAGGVGAPTTVSLQNLTITGGKTLGGGTDNLGDYGGALRTDFSTDVTISGSVFKNNSAPRTGPNLIFGLGGAIASDARLTILDSRFETNSASNSGGAIYIGGSGAVTVIRNSTFTGNTSSGGGAIKNHQVMTIESSTFSGNTALSAGQGQGGAIDNNGGGDLTLVNSTLTGNVSVFGGAIYNAETITVRNSTLAGNTGGFGGGAFTFGSVASFENTIIAGNTASTEGPDVDGPGRSLGHNLVGNTANSTGFSAGVGDLLNVDPKLGALADNGGPTQTMALLAGSPAIDAANTATAPATDQRGVSRPQGPAADIGAFEAPANRAPVANNDSYSVNEDTQLTVGAASGVLANDTDPDGDKLTAVLVSGPAHGTLTFGSDGSFAYRASLDFNGTDSFSYKANDGQADSNVATVTLTVNPVNDPPVARTDNYSTDEDMPLTVAAPGVLATDTDVDGDKLTAQLFIGPSHGTLALNGDGSFTYTPAANYNGTDAFAYKASDGTALSNPAVVNITIRTVNDAPVARDDSYTVDEDQVLTVKGAAGTLLFLNSQPGDFVGGGKAQTFTPATGTFKASRNFDNGASIDYQGFADPGSFWFLDFAAPGNVPLVPGHYANAARFPFQASNQPGMDVSGEGRGSNTLTGNFTVTEAVYGVSGEVLSFGASFEQHSEGAAPALFGEVRYNAAPTTDGVLLNDTDLDGGPLHAVLVSGPSHGTLALGPSGAFVYTPDPNFNGTDSFSYRANDGSLDSNVATATITVRPANDAPAAHDDSYVTDEDTPLTVSAPGVLGNDADVDGDTLKAVLVTGPSHGTLTLNGDGSFTYAPAADYNGADSFTYKANDGALDSNVATVTLIVRPVNDAPVARGDAFATDEDTPLTVSAPGVLGNDTDVDSPTLTAVLVTGPAHGTLALNSDGGFSYAPAANYNGPDSFAYKANDGQADSGTATVSLTVTPVDDAPVAANDSYSTAEDTPLTVAVPGVLGNDSDVDGDTLNAALVSGPAHGTLTLNSNGSFLYTPAAGFSGSDTFTYRASDGSLEALATVSISVTPSPATSGRVTGSGSTDGGVRRFNLNVQSRDGAGGLTFSGLVSFEDRQGGISLTSTSITSLRVEADGARATVRGTATVNGVSGYTFTVFVEDNGEPGRNDKFRIVLTGPGGFAYDSLDLALLGGLLDSGNIQVHKK
jgi:VCBS repeat-containing protein